MKRKATTKPMITPVVTGRSHQVTARLPLDLYERLVAHQERRQAALPALTYGLTDALRELLLDALDRAEKGRKR